MKTEMIHMDSMLLGGAVFYGDPISIKGSWDSENEIGKTCNRFMEYISQNPERPYSCNKPYIYEVHIYGNETASKGYFEVFVGEEVNSAKLPVSLSSKFFPETDYLKITLYGNEIISDWWKELDSDILPANCAKRNASFIIQAYDERFKGMDNIRDSIMDVYIPVQTV